MEVGIAIPGMLPGTSGDLLLEWALRADRGPFSSISMGERIAYPCYDAMTALAAAAAVTDRVRIVSSVLILPVHDEVMLAKQAATLDRLSAGRLRLGVGIGGRDEDCRVAGRPVRRDYRTIERQVRRVRAIWSGEPPFDGSAPVGPSPAQPQGPPLLAAVNNAATASRVASWADGVHPWSFGAAAEEVEAVYAAAERAWERAGRRTRPLKIAGFYCALGPDAEHSLRRFVHDYHTDMTPARLRSALGGKPCTTASVLRERLDRFAGVGTDEVLLVPTTNEIDQISRIAEVVG